MPKKDGREKSSERGATFSTKGRTAKKHKSDETPKYSAQAATGESFSTKGRSAQSAGGLVRGVSTNETRTWSEQQQAIFKEAADGEQHLIVEALAGTGKTTTIVEATKYLSGSVLLCAFNKRIAEELQARLDAQPGPNVKAKTLHALGFSYLQRAAGQMRVDADRLTPIIRKVFNANQKGLTPDALGAMKRLVTLVKETVKVQERTAREHYDAIYAVDVAFGCTDLCNEKDRETVLSLCGEVLLECSRLDQTCDFSDMLWLPLVHNFIKPDFDVVIVDEAQDMNAAQLQIAQRVCRKGGRIIVVGDKRQAIYGFRGASVDSIDRLERELKAKKLKLTTTYRCGHAIVKEAQRFVPEFQAASGNPQGLIRHLLSGDVPVEAKPGDFILSRANAPLMGVCLALVRQGKRAKVEGKEIGKGLLGILNKLRVSHITEVAAAVNEWSDRLCRRLDPEKDSDRIGQINDQADVLAVLAEEASDLNDMRRMIDNLFADTGNAKDTIVCSTVHKAKGLEASRVYLLEWTFRSKKNENPASASEEKNIRYVALTRAINELVFVYEKPVAQKEDHEEDEGWNEAEGHDELGKPI